MSINYGIRYRADAGGFVRRFAGQWATPDGEGFATYDEAEAIRRACPNGDHMEVVHYREQVPA